MPTPPSPPQLLDGVFEGGGVKGIGLVGAITHVEQQGYAFEHVAGTSAGAIVASLLAAGYTSSELYRIISTVDYTKFLDPWWGKRIPLVGSALSILLRKGLYKGDYFEQWLGELLAAKGVRTFGDLQLSQFSGHPKYYYRLRVTASDITHGTLLALPQDAALYDVHPDELEVARAVRMSVSIPFFYEPATWLSRSGAYYSHIVDGGLLSNFPVWLFDEDGHTPTLGFKLVDAKDDRPHLITGPISLLAALFSTMLEAHDNRYISENDFARTVAIDTLQVKTTDFGISKEESEALYRSGYEAARRFMTGFSSEDYWSRYGHPSLPHS